MKAMPDFKREFAEAANIVGIARKNENSATHKILYSNCPKPYSIYIHPCGRDSYADIMQYKSFESHFCSIFIIRNS